MKLKENPRHHILTVTSMGVRLTPADRQPMHAGGLMHLEVTSAESNVVSIASYLGLSAKVLSKFVAHSPVSRLIRDNLAGRHIDVEGPEVEQGGPWGYRHQFNLADSGYGLRGPRVHNDRAGEVGRTMEPKDFDLDRIFRVDGVAVVHLSGLIAAMSRETAELCLEVARTARRHGTRISFDLNHRASFWAGREDELRETFREIASLADILVGNEEDFQLCLNIPGPEAGGRDLADKMESFREMIRTVQQRFPDVSVYATTLREVMSANTHLWGALLSVDGQWYTAEPREIPVIDRIGGGDGFVGGLLYGILRGWEPEQWLQFGWASGALAVTMLTDYAQPADEAQIWSIWQGNARVQR